MGMDAIQGRLALLLFAGSTLFLSLGGVAWLFAPGVAADTLWLLGTALGLVVALASTMAALRRHRPTVDVIALLALCGALALGELFAGAVITMMLTTGLLLEARAEARARRELRLLIERSPRTARRRLGDKLIEISVDEVRSWGSTGRAHRRCSRGGWTAAHRGDARRVGTDW